MEKSISLDIAALILLIILLLSCILRKMTSDLSNRIFLIIILCAIASTVFDIIAVALDNVHSDQTSLLYAVNAGYLYMHFLSAPMHLIFVISLTDTWHKLRKNHFMQFMLILPLFVMLVAFVANAGNQLVFSVENGYTRGPLFGMMYVATVLYIVFDILYIIRYRKLFNFSKILTISAVIPIGMAAMLIQLFIPTALVEMFAGAVSLLIISIGIQRPEDYIDSFTLLMKHSAYANDMKRTFYNEKHVNIIMLNIGNFRTIQRFSPLRTGWRLMPSGLTS